MNPNKIINVYIRSFLADAQIAILGECEHEHCDFVDEETRHQWVYVYRMQAVQWDTNEACTDLY